MGDVGRMVSAGVARRLWFALAAVLSSSAASLAQAAPPNIVFILIDDLGWADLGCYGSTFHETPRLDALAKEGIRFTNAYAAAPVCSPTRASIMSGKTPAAVGVTDFLGGKRSPIQSPVRPAPFRDYMPLEEVTIAEALKEAGYVTGHVGKWHLGGPGFLPEDQGFDFNYAGAMSGMPKSFFWPEWKGNPEVEGSERGEYLTDALTREACGFIERSKDQPFYLYLSHYAVHIPLEAKPELVEKYRKKAESMGPEPYGQRNADYAAMLESVDQSVGAVLDTLDAQGLADNTIVVFFADNGGLSVQELYPNTPATTNAPLRGGKGYLYEGGLREPCLLRWPGVAPVGAVSDAPIISHDFFPTFCVAAGITEFPVGVEGVDLTPLIREPSEPFVHPPLFFHYPHFSNQGGQPGSVIRDGDWKLIERHEDGTLQLFNVVEDVSEKRNLAQEKPELVAAMREELRAWRAKVGAKMPEANPTYR